MADLGKILAEPEARRRTLQAARDFIESAELHGTARTDSQIVGVLHVLDETIDAHFEVDFPTLHNRMVGAWEG